MPLLNAVWMETTEPETSLDDSLPVGASPLLAVADPEPDLFELTLDSELLVGKVIRPLVRAP